MRPGFRRPDGATDADMSVSKEHAGRSAEHWAQENVRLYEALQPGEKQPLLNHIVASVTLMIYVGWVNIFAGLLIACFFSKIALYVVIALLTTLWLPAKPLLWGPLLRSWIFKTWREYFRYSYIMEERLDPTKRYILAEFPHGTFPIAPIVASTLFQTLFPHVPVYSVAASSLFYIPFWRHFIAWVGSLPATKESFTKLLKKGSVAVVLGGIAEMYMVEPNKERVKLLGRKGYAKIAVEQQIDGVVPVYYFGNSQCLDMGPKSLSGISRKWRVSLALYMYGRFWLPLPRPVDLLLVHGRPIPVPKVDVCDKAAVEAAMNTVHDGLVKELQEMYDRHKKGYGWADRPLSIE